VLLKFWHHSVQDKGVGFLGLHEILDEETAVKIYQYARRNIPKYFKQKYFIFRDGVLWVCV
jgi:hypothetical protein